MLTTERQTDRQTNRQTDGRTDRQRQRDTERQIKMQCIHIYSMREREGGREEGKSIIQVVSTPVARNKEAVISTSKRESEK